MPKKEDVSSIGSGALMLDTARINCETTAYLIAVHIGAVAAFAVIRDCSIYTHLFALSLWPISGLGITAGAHRLWSHRSFKAGFGVRMFLMLCNCVANEGSIYHWCRNHRLHHKHSETDADPHNASRGFFFSHIGWMMEKRHPDVLKASKQFDFDDLLADPVVAFQLALDPLLSLFFCFGMPPLVASHVWGESVLNAFLVAGVLRYTILLHFTWLVNSAAHLYGDRPYDDTIGPREHRVVTIGALGEGWHNWHHTYPYDYAASEFGVSGQFNPTKLFIDAAAKMGLVWDRKRALDAWAIRKHKLRRGEIEEEKLQLLEKKRLRERQNRLLSPTRTRTMCSSNFRGATRQTIRGGWETLNNKWSTR